jgi:hypothetical protein
MTTLNIRGRWERERERAEREGKRDRVISTFFSKDM